MGQNADSTHDVILVKTLAIQLGLIALLGLAGDVEASWNDGNGRSWAIIACHVFIAFGSVCMFCLRLYPIAVAAAFLSMIPGYSPGFCYGIPAGVMAFGMLLVPESRKLFANSSPLSAVSWASLGRRASSESDRTVIAGRGTKRTLIRVVLCVILAVAIAVGISAWSSAWGIKVRLDFISVRVYPVSPSTTGVFIKCRDKDTPKAVREIEQYLQLEKSALVQMTVLKTVTDSGLETILGISAAKDIKRLSIHSTVTNVGLGSLSHCQNLESLDISNCREVHGAGPISFQSLSKLRIVVFANTNLDDKCLTVFARLPSLETLDASDSAITAEGMAMFRAARPDVNIVENKRVK